MSDASLAAENAALRAENAGLRAELAELKGMVAALTERVGELERERAADSSNSSRPPSSDAPWSKQPAKKRSSRTRSGRKPGKQPGSASFSRSLTDDPDERLEIHPDRCGSCEASLRGAGEHGRQRRQIVDVAAAPPPTGTEYQRISKAFKVVRPPSLPLACGPRMEREPLGFTPELHTRLGRTQPRMSGQGQVLEH